MASPIITLADNLKTKLEANTSFTFTRRNAPYFKREDVEDGKWIIVAAGDEQAIRARNVDRSTLIVDVAYQETMPDKTDANPDPSENMTFFDNRMLLVEEVKNLFRGGGPLRNTTFDAGNLNALNQAIPVYFQSMSNSPIYRPDMIRDYQIFTSVVRLEFAGELPYSNLN